MKSINLLIVAAFSLALPSKANAENFTYNWFTDLTSTIQFFSVDGTAKIDSNYTVELGVMSGPVTTAQSVASNFLSLNISTTWDPNIGGTGNGGAGATFDYSELSVFPNGITSTIANPSYITAWIYNSKSISATSQWAVLSNTSWVLTPLDTTTPTSKDFTITDLGTSYSFGTLQGNKVILASASAIPEPSTCAALLGAGVLGLAVYRRRRSAV